MTTTLIRIALGLVVAGGVFSIVAVLVSRASRWRKPVEVAVVVLGVVYALLQLGRGPDVRYSGILTPKWSGAKIIIPRSSGGYVMNYGGGGNIWEVDPRVGTTIQPLGPDVPLLLTMTPKGLRVSAVVTDVDGKVVAEVLGTSWQVNPNNYFRLNFDKSAIEVIDQYDIPVLQVEYLTPNTVRVGGVFQSARGQTEGHHPGFPMVTPGARQLVPLVVPHGGFTVLSSTGVFSRAGQIRPEDRGSIRAMLTPWFDYSTPDRKGVRSPQ